MILKVLGWVFEGWLAVTGIVCIWAIVSGLIADHREHKREKRRQLEVDADEQTRELRYLLRTRAPLTWEER